jgi:hypothetical protein
MRNWQANLMPFITDKAPRQLSFAYAPALPFATDYHPIIDYFYFFLIFVFVFVC